MATSIGLPVSHHLSSTRRRSSCLTYCSPLSPTPPVRVSTRRVTRYAKRTAVPLPPRHAALRSRHSRSNQGVGRRQAGAGGVEHASPGRGRGSGGRGEVQAESRGGGGGNRARVRCTWRVGEGVGEKREGGGHRCKCDKGPSTRPVVTPNSRTFAHPCSRRCTYAQRCQRAGASGWAKGGQAGRAGVRARRPRAGADP